jgi:lipid-A-disaccharide synthase-like uncharacterized protein
MSMPEHGWTALGFVGQLFFSARFAIQWVASEIRKRSTVPVSFWFLSIAGSLILLAYAIHKKDPVFIVGQSAGLLVYSRNLVLIRRSRIGAGVSAV